MHSPGTVLNSQCAGGPRGGAKTFGEEPCPPRPPSGYGPDLNTRECTQNLYTITNYFNLWPDTKKNTGFLGGRTDIQKQARNGNLHDLMQHPFNNDAEI